MDPSALHACLIWKEFDQNQAPAVDHAAGDDGLGREGRQRAYNPGDGKEVFKAIA
jgi:hypothetical protein